MHKLVLPCRPKKTMSGRGFAHKFEYFCGVKPFNCACVHRSAFHAEVVGSTPIGMQVQLLHGPSMLPDKAKFVV